MFDTLARAMRTSLLALFLSAAASFAAESDLRAAITLHASFDDRADADFARGDKILYSAPSMKQPRTGTPGLPSTGVVSRVPGGKFGSALRFHKKASEMIFFKGEKNIDYQHEMFDGTISLWLNLTPDEDLEPGYTDPIQITPRDWNDAAFFVEFTKDEKPREFRLGAYADFKVWNPQNRPWEHIPFEEKPLIKVLNPPFKRGEWTHILFTFSNYNTGKTNAVTRLYLNGELKGELSPREQMFTWDISATKIMLGLSYVGLFDELTIFERGLTDAEVSALYALPKGVAGLLKQ